MQKKGHIDNSQRTEKSCETTPTNKIDYSKWGLHMSRCSFARVCGKGNGISTVSAVCLSSVYKVKVVNVTNDLITDAYLMKIETVIKEGGYDLPAPHRLLFFSTHFLFVCESQGPPTLLPLEKCATT